MIIRFKAGKMHRLLIDTETKTYTDWLISTDYIFSEHGEHYLEISVNSFKKLLIQTRLNFSYIPRPL